MMSEEERRRGERRHGRPEQGKQEHADAVERTVRYFKVLWASGWEPFLLNDRLALVTTRVHESVREELLLSANVSMLEALQRLHRLEETESGRVVLRDARVRFEAWLSYEVGGADE